MLNRPLLTLGLLALHSAAFAAADLTVSLTPPIGARVEDTARYSVTVRNTGNKSAFGVSVTIQLPLTHTTPVYTLGTVTAFDSRCVRTGSQLTCGLATVIKNSVKTVFVDLKLPYSAAPTIINVSASTTSAENSYTNNALQHTVALAAYEVPVTATVDIVNQHCTGRDLSSFFECQCFPSSISDHSAVLNYDVDHSISFPLYGPEYGGTWSQPSPDRLVMEYTENGIPIATFEGYGVPGNCFDGITTFIPASPYMAVYRVCLQ